MGSLPCFCLLLLSCLASTLAANIPNSISVNVYNNTSVIQEGYPPDVIYYPVEVEENNEPKPVPVEGNWVWDPTTQNWVWQATQPQKPPEVVPVPVDNWVWDPTTQTWVWQATQSQNPPELKPVPVDNWVWDPATQSWVWEATQPQKPPELKPVPVDNWVWDPATQSWVWQATQSQNPPELKPVPVDNWVWDPATQSWVWEATQPQKPPELKPVPVDNWVWDPATQSWVWQATQSQNPPELKPVPVDNWVWDPATQSWVWEATQPQKPPELKPVPVDNWVWDPTTQNWVWNSTSEFNVWDQTPYEYNILNECGMGASDSSAATSNTSDINDTTDIDDKFYDPRETIGLPDSFDARENWPQCHTLKAVYDQGACNSGWAIASVTAITDRYCIASNGTKEFYASAEDALTCSGGGDCLDGGESKKVYLYWENRGIVSGGGFHSRKGCKPYRLPPCPVHYRGLPCHPTSFLLTLSCMPYCMQGYPGSHGEDRKFASEVYRLREEIDIKADIYYNGPVTALMNVYDDFVTYRRGVYKRNSETFWYKHYVKLIGWGEYNGDKYWLAANSWNVEWGESGFFKILRGENHCDIETFVIGGTPKL